MIDRYPDKQVQSAAHRDWRKALRPYRRLAATSVADPPGPDLTVIKATVFTGGGDGPVASHHKQVFQEHTNGAAANVRSAIAELAAWLRRLDDECTRLQSRLNGTSPTKRVANPEAARECWTLFDAISALMFGAIAIGVPFVSLFTLRWALWKSGVIDTKEETSLFATIVLLAPIALKLVHDELRTDLGKSRYRLVLSASAAVFVSAWAVLFVAAFGHGIAELATDSLPTLYGGSDGPGHGTALAVITLALLAEPCAAAASWIKVERIFKERQGFGFAVNPEYRAYKRLLRRLGRERHAVARVHAKLVARLNALDAAEEVYVNRALSIYRSIVTMRKNDTLIWNELTVLEGLRPVQTPRHRNTNMNGAVE